MNVYAIAYKDSAGFTGYIKDPTTDSYMIYDTNQAATKAASFIKEHYKELIAPKQIVKRKFFKKEITYERLPDTIRDKYTRIIKTLHVKKVSIL